MIYELHICRVLQEIEAAIDSFNNKNLPMRACYPDLVEIEYQGVRLTVPFTIRANDHSTQPGDQTP